MAGPPRRVSTVVKFCETALCLAHSQSSRRYRRRRLPKSVMKSTSICSRPCSSMTRVRPTHTLRRPRTVMANRNPLSPKRAAGIMKFCSGEGRSVRAWRSLRKSLFATHRGRDVAREQHSRQLLPSGFSETYTIIQFGQLALADVECAPCCADAIQSHEVGEAPHEHAVWRAVKLARVAQRQLLHILPFLELRGCLAPTIPSHGVLLFSCCAHVCVLGVSGVHVCTPLPPSGKRAWASAGAVKVNGVPRRAHIHEA